MSERTPRGDLDADRTDELPPEVRAAWGHAQKLWQVHMHDPHVPERGEKLRNSLAWFSFPPSITVNRNVLERLGASEEWESVFAHELGHHVLAPSTRLDSLKIRHQMARALVASGSTQVSEEALGQLSNLWTDLLVNTRVEVLQRRVHGEKATTPGIVRLLTITSQFGFNSDDRLWWVYRRTYELLWNLTPETMCPSSPPAAIPHRSTEIVEASIDTITREYLNQEIALRAARRERQRIDDELSATMCTRPEVDAGSIARLVRTFAGDAVSGALRFGMIAAPYLVEQERLGEDSAQHSADPGAGVCAADTAPATADELGRLLADRRLHEPLPDLSEHDIPVNIDPRVDDRVRGQSLDIARTLDLYAPSGDGAVLAAWYRSQASRWVRTFTERRPSLHAGNLPGPLELWEIGDDLADLDWPSTLRRGPQIVPGVSTLQRSYLDDDAEPAEAGIELDLYLDASGSMPNPRQGSPAVLAGTILALSVLRGGGRVRVTVFSGPGEVAGTTGFVRDHVRVVTALAWYPGNGTTFPLDLYGFRYEHLPIADERVRRHLVVISDDGLVSMFGEGNEEFIKVAPAVRPKLTTATLVLQDHRHQVAPLAEAAGYDIFYLESMEDAPQVCAKLAGVLHG
ncbi:MAG: VWA domain-containing protein [Microbacteriaceae bacterium]|nr:VWA domain-containing protein [Microbacteriaceae bacterium]